jgi:hypothetical protein
MANDKIFANGFIFKRNEKAPDFVIGNISIKSEDAIQFIQDHTKNGWVNLKINKSQGGKAYIELDTWEAKGSEQAPAPAPAPAPKNDFFDDEPPF